MKKYHFRPFAEEQGLSIYPGQDLSRPEVRQPGISEHSGFLSRWRVALHGSAIFLVALALYSLAWHYGLKGGASTIGAERVLNGEIPYRDFWTIYAPGHFYLLAFLFKLFGVKLLVEVVAASILCAVAASLCFWLVVQLVADHFLALGASAIIFAAAYNTGYSFRLDPYPPAIVFILLALNFFVLYLKTGKTASIFLSGIAAGCIMAFKHDVGIYTALSIGAGIVIFSTIRSGSKHGLETRRLAALVTRLAYFYLGVVVIILPLLTYFSVVAGPDMLWDIYIFPLTDFRFARPEVYPSLLPTNLRVPSLQDSFLNLFNYLRFAFPFLLSVLGILLAIYAMVRRDKKLAALGSTFSTGFVLHYLAAHLQVNTHIITMSVYSSLLGALLVKELSLRVRPKWRGGIKVLALGLLGVWFVANAAQPAFLTWKARHSGAVKLDLPRASGIYVSPAQATALNGLAAFMNANRTPGQKLFVGLKRHDIVIVNDPVLYFLLDLPSATRYQELHPGIADTEPFQQEIVADLQKNDVPFIILESRYKNEKLDRVKQKHRLNLPNVGALVLDDYIQANYRRVENFGTYSVWALAASGE